VDECKPLPAAASSADMPPAVASSIPLWMPWYGEYPSSAAFSSGTFGQGLTLVNFSAQPEPSLTQNTP